MTISIQALTGADKANLRKLVNNTKKKEERKKLDRRLARIIREAIEESGDPAINDAIANKIKERIL
jgi:hypothetical protein